MNCSIKLWYLRTQKEPMHIYNTLSGSMLKTSIQETEAPAQNAYHSCERMKSREIYRMTVREGYGNDAASGDGEILSPLERYGINRRTLRYLPVALD